VRGGAAASCAKAEAARTNDPRRTDKVPGYMSGTS
jgi:hypothetical protein